MSEISRRTLMLAGVAGWAASPAISRLAIAATSASAPGIDPMTLVLPELREPLQAALAMIRRTPGLDTEGVNDRNLSAMRAMPPFRQPLAAPAYEQRFISGRNGAPDVRVFVVNAAPGRPPRPAVLHTHGGGFVTGNPTGDLANLQTLCLEHDCVAVSVDYRLAPETRLAGSLEDNYAALKWLHGSAAELGVDPARIALLGESAGGGHAAMLAIAARDRGEVPVAAQILIYPMLDDRTASSRELPAHIGTFVWNAASNRFGWSSLLGVPAGSRRVPEGAVPARLDNLARLPPAFIGVGSLDLFVEEDIEYARRLLLAGVPTELLVVPGAYHGFVNIAAQAPVSQRFRAAWNAALARAFVRAQVA